MPFQLIATALCTSHPTNRQGQSLVGVKPVDPVTYGSVAGLLALVALAACYLPARRAMRVDAMVSPRYE